ncbi:unnamed protein product [Miscanthus lutarioriparius]|uniref:Uncharacterized protein n=1 Tax=Miscanthus lutarioriparius TaxID=422564 RepID=A0A811PH30_9POAL|nr:unnamed protein product [Miscanthus lutarioriparius]
MATQKGKEKTEGLDDGAPEPTLEERLEGLNLQGVEEEDLDFLEEFEELIKDVRCAMRNAWAAAKEVTFKVMALNLFLVQLHCLGDWTRTCIQGVPEGLMKKRELAEKVAKKVGDLITVVVNKGKINPTPYLRARVWLELSKPLVRVVPITLKKRMMYLV